MFIHLKMPDRIRIEKNFFSNFLSSTASSHILNVRNHLRSAAEHSEVIDPSRQRCGWFCQRENVRQLNKFCNTTEIF